MAMEAELTAARKERDEATTISRVFQEFTRNLRDVINKIWLYDESIS